MYRVFLVEDEIVTREGIRDNVDWKSAGFEFCGEAPDGEIALPLIEELKPDVLITDIKMPFMDGLQLSKIIRSHMPWIKIIILSGHNEFEYAQSALKLGVTEYLLKPISAKEMGQVLENLSTTLEQEKHERDKLKNLQKKIDDNLALSREKFLLSLVMGGVSSAEAFELSQQFGLDIVAKYYIVVLIRIELSGSSQPFDYQVCQQVEAIVSGFAGNNLDVYLTKKDLEELILLIKGDDLEQLIHEGNFLTNLIKKEVENRAACNIVIEVGSPQNRIGDIHHSFAEALVQSKSALSSTEGSGVGNTRVNLFGMDRSVIENYLKFGSTLDFADFFSKVIQPVAQVALQSHLMKHYLFVDIILTVTQFVSDLGGKAEELALDVRQIEQTLKEINSMGEIEAETRRIFFTAVKFRDSQIIDERVNILNQARAYIDTHFSDTEIKMSVVAEKFNISSSHFSTIFHQEFGITYRDYLREVRIKRAKELLGTTNFKISEIAYQSGFNDSHYFSSVFKNMTGLTPRAFRAQIRDNIKVE